MSSAQANKASLLKDVLVDSPLGAGLFQLQSCRYRESLGQPFRAR